MRRRNLCWLPLTALAVALPLAAGPDEPIRPTVRIQLFNGVDLTGWVLFAGGADPAATFSAGDGVIRVSGKPAGYLRTAARYTNYRLTLQWRWADKPGNSGCLLHMSEPDKVWPRSIEAQLQHQNAGDFWVIDGTEFAEHRGREGRRTPKRAPHNELAPGEWNTMQVICDGDRIEVYVNGLLQNVATAATVTAGHICLQSEGAPIEFANVVLDPL